VKKHVSYSQLKLWLDHHPAKAAWLLEHPPEPSDVMRRGQIIEALIDGRDPMVARGPDVSRSTKIWKEWAKEQDPARSLIKEGEWAQMSAAAQSAVQWVGCLLENSRRQERIEASIDGQLVVAVPDYQCADKVVRDLKVSDVSRFERQVYSLHWDLQAYIYTEICRPEHGFEWVVIDPSEPYVCQRFRAEASVLEVGRGKWERSMAARAAWIAGDIEAVRSVSYSSYRVDSWTEDEDLGDITEGGANE